MTFTFIPSTPPLSLSFNFLFRLLDWPVGSGSLNISPCASWVVCPWAAPEGTAGGLCTPCWFENTEKKIPCSNGRFPAAWQLGQQQEEQGDLFIFSLDLLAIFRESLAIGNRL